MVNKIKKNFTSGVIKQPEDNRDFIFKSNLVPTDLPNRFLNKHIREIETQLSTNACVANATCSGLEMMYTDNELNLSRMFVYYNAREPYPDLRGHDGGVYVRDGFKAINHLGVCSETDWKFIPEQVNTKPSQKAYQNATDNKLIKYERLSDIHSIKSAVFQKQAIVFGIPITSEFIELNGPLESQNYKASGYNMGGHAMSIVGYDNNLGGFIVENSWGTNWGDNGLCLIKYDIFSFYFFDVWTATEINFEVSKHQEPQEPDNLTKLVGIGKVYQKVLNSYGIYTFLRVSNMTESEIQTMESKHHFRGDFRKTVSNARELVHNV